MIKKLYIVKCYMEGCEECGDEYHIVGAFSTKKLAEDACSIHENYKHLHPVSIGIVEVVLDDYIFLFDEKNG